MAGNLVILSYPERIETWLLISKSVDEVWQVALVNLTAILAQFELQLERY
ncbi:MAG: hypothetical protein ACTMUB_07820 [cyanobacterium endosymbiont of Rhopalodia musculus]|nr:hypothetical protein [cyanobacterium endosymbiont of Epithemia clementina EcSB]WGT67995.1 hypothetical protein P3F56_02625 [cyanobacterium endosymbiont of Epithemia clementina EcSB]